MSTGSSSELDRGLLTEKAEAFFSDVFPGATIQICEYEPAQADKIASYGLWIADIITEEADVLSASFVFSDTLYTRALAEIADFEEHDALPPGCHDQAIDQIFSGTFVDNWTSLLTKLRSLETS